MSYLNYNLGSDGSDTFSDDVWVCDAFPTCPCRQYWHREPEQPHDCNEGHAATRAVDRSELWSGMA